jgi:quercetin dioxygenase-like cupin family protein
MTPTVQIVRNAEADTLWVVRDRIRFMGEVANTDLSVLEVEVPPGSGTPPHIHASPEIFRILAGEITFGIFTDGPPSEAVAGAGTVVTVPPRAPHAYRNASAAPATMLVVVERSMADFFRDLGRRETPPAGPPSEAEIAEVMAACARHDIAILGGAPS